MEAEEWKQKIAELGTEVDTMHDSLIKLQEGLKECTGLTKLERAGADLYIEEGLFAYRNFIRIHGTVNSAALPFRLPPQVCVEGE